MKEISVFKISFDVDLSRLKNLPTELDKILKSVQSDFDNVSERISKGTTAIVPDLEVNLGLILGVIVATLRKKIVDVITGIIAGLIIKQVTKEISESIEGSKTELERLKDLETEVITFRRQAIQGLQDVEKFGERPTALDESGLPLDTAAIQERIDLLNTLLEKIVLVREELTHGALQSGIPEQPKLTPIPKFGQPGEVIVVPPQLDRIKTLEDELRKIIEGTNGKIEERSQLLLLLENAYASLDGPTTDLVFGQGLMTDAFNGSTISAVNLAEKGINPLTGKASELGISLEDLFNNTNEGAVIFGYTKEQLDGLRDVTDDAAKSAENLGENGLTVASEKAGQAGKSVGALDANLLNLADRNKDVADLQDKVNQTVEDSSVAYDNAGESAENYGDTVEQVQNQGGFFEGIKQGFIDFVENVQSNSELMADFFANTLSQMSQSFSDLFFNIITGKFEDLKDLAKQAFEAILRAFLDLVSAIATRQIVISIGGLFGIGKGAQAAGGGGNPIDIAQQGAGVVGSGLGLFGSTGAFATLGAGLGLSSSAAFTTAAGGGTALLGTGSFAAGGAVGAQAAEIAATPGFLATAGAAITVVGAVLAAAALVATIVLPLLKKTPRFAFKFESVETEVGERAAVVKEFLDADFFSEEIFKKIVGRGGKGAFSEKEVDDLKKAIQKAIEETINSVQEIINKLPGEMADILNEALLNTAVDTETKIGRSNLLGFDAKGGKEIKERLEKFFQGDLQGRFLFAIRDFFQFAFEQLGVLPDKAAAFIDTEFERFKNAKSPEERAQIGQEFLASFNAFVDAFNIVSGNVNDAIGQTIQSINSLSSELGFEAVPSIGELTDKLGELLENAELDPETVQKYADLRNAIVQGISDIINSITGLIGKISQLNSTIVSLGGSAVNIVPFLDEAQAKLMEFYSTNVGNLSLGEQEMFLDELLGIANAKLAEEQAAFQRAQEARQKAEEAQRARIEKRIDNLNKEKDKINEVFQERIDALNEELRIAEDFAQLTESIRQTLDSILFSPESVLTGVEQVSALQSNIANLQAQLASTTDPEKQLDIAGRLEEAFKTLFDTAGDAFGVNSPEFVATGKGGGAR